MMKQVLGLILLALGLGVIFWGLYSSYNIFSGNTEPPAVFKVSPLRLEESSSGIEALLKEQLKGFIPVDFGPRLLNLLTWSIFSGIVIFAGSQIAGLGIKLIK